MVSTLIKDKYVSGKDSKDSVGKSSYSHLEQDKNTKRKLIKPIFILFDL